MLNTVKKGQTMLKEKKIYLKGYLIQEAKIKRLKQLIETNVKNKKQYEEKILFAQNLRKEIEFKIESLDDEVLKELIYNKYILGKTLEEISYIINYSKRHVERLHIKALEKINI